MGYQSKEDILAKWEANATTEDRLEALEAKQIRKDLETARAVIADGLARYKKKKLKARSKKAAQEDPFAELAGYESRQQIQDEYGWETITEARMDKLLALWDLREESQRRKADDGFHDRVTDMLETAMWGLVDPYADFLAGFDEKQRQKERDAEKVARENNERTWEREHQE